VCSFGCLAEMVNQGERLPEQILRLRYVPSKLGWIYHCYAIILALLVCGVDVRAAEPDATVVDVAAYPIYLFAFESNDCDEGNISSGTWISFFNEECVCLGGEQYDCGQTDCTFRCDLLASMKRENNDLLSVSYYKGGASLPKDPTDKLDWSKYCKDLERTEVIKTGRCNANPTSCLPANFANSLEDTRIQDPLMSSCWYDVFQDESSKGGLFLSSTTLLVLYVIGGLLVLAGVGIGGWFVFRKFYFRRSGSQYSSVVASGAT